MAMTLLIIAYLGGALTILSPCILPILPFVFARAGQPFFRSTLPMLAGMALTFAIVATLATVGGSWAVQANEYGRLIAILLIGVFGITLISPAVASRLAQPVTSLGNKLLNASVNGRNDPSAFSSAVLGVATGLLWAPCAGPILGLVLTGSALQGANLQTTFLLLAYAGGAVTSLAVALLLGGGVFTAMKRSMGISERVRQCLGVAILAGVTVIALGWDTTLLSRLSYASTSSFEQAVLNKLQTGTVQIGGTEVASNTSMAGSTGTGAAFSSGLPDLGKAAGFDGAVEWLNSGPLSMDQLRGKVVLVDFWTYSCINCIRTIPYIRGWDEKYKGQGLVVVGAHTPEFAFEKKSENVRRAVADFGINFPVAIDNNYAIWRAFGNRYWPANYLIDAKGHIRYVNFGEGNYAKTEQAIQDLLREAGKETTSVGTISPSGKGTEVAGDFKHVRSEETYLGYKKATDFQSPGGIRPDVSQTYEPGKLDLNEWGLSGQWTVGPEAASLDKSNGSITYKFSARDLHLVLGPSADGKPIRFQVTVDGEVPKADHGTDTDENGHGTVTETKLYQLVRQSGDIRTRTFSIQFIDPGVEAYAFTFG
jgi:cytochrome c biogenesis protein CcdA/peroxiredoxin